MPNFFVCVLSVQIEKCKHRRLLDISSQVNFPHMLRFFCGWMAFLFTTRILVLEFLSGSLIVALRSAQPVTVDSKVKRNLNLDNSELPRPSNCLRLQWSKWNTAIHVTVTTFFSEYNCCFVRILLLCSQQACSWRWFLVTPAWWLLVFATSLTAGWKVATLSIIPSALETTFKLTHMTSPSNWHWSNLHHRSENFLVV